MLVTLFEKWKQSKGSVPYSYQILSAFPAAKFATSYINKASIYGTFGVKLCLGQTATHVMEVP